MLNIFCCKDNNDSSCEEDDEIEIQNSSDSSSKLEMDQFESEMDQFSNFSFHNKTSKNYLDLSDF